MPLLADLKARARQLKNEVATLYLATRHPGTPWYAKLFVVAIVAYALSPIDLIPDFIPVLGFLDEIVLLPFAIALAIKMIPGNVLDECRARATADAARVRTPGESAQRSSCSSGSSSLSWPRCGLTTPLRMSQAGRRRQAF